MNYIKLESVLRLIPKPLLLHSSKYDFLSWMLDALNFLPSIIRYENKVEILEFSDYKSQLPENLALINTVAYLYKEPCSEDIDSLQTCIEDNENNEETVSPGIDGCVQLRYSMFLDSPYYRNNFMYLRHAGKKSPIICSDCPNLYATCSEHFTIDKYCTMHLSIKEGFLCIDYESKGDPDCILIPDDQFVQNFLATYAIHKHWEERSAAKEDGAFQYEQLYSQRAEILKRSAKGSIILKNTDHNTISNIVGGMYNKLIKIPEKYVYSR